MRPLDIALIGTGFRSRTVYRPLLPALAACGVRVTAVCDPVRDSADDFARSLGVPAFYSLRDLVAARPMEAALVCTPVDLFHSISCYLSAHGIHNMVEAAFAGSLAQARGMIAAAEANGVVLAVAEQFFRLAYDRLAKDIAETGFIGPVNRIVSVFAHTGTHNSAAWRIFFGSDPDSAQSVEHTMPVVGHRSLAHRRHTDETFHANFFTFPGLDGSARARLVADMTSNAKGVLGRHPRPGYTQYEGQQGAITLRTPGQWHGPYHQVEGEVRYTSDEGLETNGVTDTVYPMVFSQENEFLRMLHVNLPTGRVEYRNPFYRPLDDAALSIDYYHAGTAEAVLEFARAIRGEGTLEYPPTMACTVMMMGVGARESALRNGQRIALPLEGGEEAENQLNTVIRARTGMDPLEVEGMLDYQAPRT